MSWPNSAWMLLLRPLLTSTRCCWSLFTLVAVETAGERLLTLRDGEDAMKEKTDLSGWNGDPKWSKRKNDCKGIQEGNFSTRVRRSRSLLRNLSLLLCFVDKISQRCKRAASTVLLLAFVAVSFVDKVKNRHVVLTCFRTLSLPSLVLICHTSF